MQLTEAQVTIRYLSSEQSPERLEKMVMEPVERSLVALARVSGVTSTANHGYVDFQIQFEGGATEQDLAIVEKQVKDLVFGSEIAITARAVRLGCVRAAE